MYKRPIIDAHTHIQTNQDLAFYESVYQPRAFLCFNFFKGFANGEFDDNIANFDHFLVNHPQKLFEIFAFDMHCDLFPQIQQLQEKLKRTNCIKGVKFYTGYQHFYPTDPRLESVYNLCAKLDLPVIFHNGALYEFPKSTAMLKYAKPIYVDEVAVSYPSTKFVITHTGFPDILETATIVSKNANVYTDLSGVIDEPSCYEQYQSDLQKAVNYYPCLNEKAMFGTDYISPKNALSEITRYIDLVETVFPEKAQENVFFHTANRLFKLNLTY